MKKPMPIAKEPTTISEQQISDLVERFYARVHKDDRLGPIFASQITGEWDEHLQKMKSFWRSVLLKSREYQGRPVPAHVKLQNIETSDFFNWLLLFRTTAFEVLDFASAKLAIQNAERIASSLWLALNPGTFSAPPDWSQITETASNEQPITSWNG